jgi:broad specificity phosphatase PhoE
MLLLLVRHAQSENNALLDRLRSECGGSDRQDELHERYAQAKSSDPGLSELGAEQAQRCGEWIGRYLRSMECLPDEYRTELVSSPMERALRTAEALAVQLSTQAEIWSDIHETKGCWRGGQVAASPGRGASEILASTGTEHFCNSAVAPVPDAGWWTDRVTGAAWEKETDEESCERARCVASRLRTMALSAEAPTVKIIVTHGNWMSLLVQALVLPEGTTLSIPAVKHDNTALTAIVLPGVPEERSCSIVQLNRSEHLDAEPAVRRTTQHTVLSGYNDGQRPLDWLPPEAEPLPQASAVEQLKSRWNKGAALRHDEVFPLSAAIAGGVIVVAGALAVLAIRSRSPRSNNVLEQALNL